MQHRVDEKAEVGDVDGGGNAAHRNVNQSKGWGAIVLIRRIIRIGLIEAVPTHPTHYQDCIEDCMLAGMRYRKYSSYKS